MLSLRHLHCLHTFSIILCHSPYLASITLDTPYDNLNKLFTIFKLEVPITKYDILHLWKACLARAIFLFKSAFDWFLFVTKLPR